MKHIKYSWLIGLIMTFLFTTDGIAKVPRFKHVILIGADGFSADAIKKHPGRYQHIERFMKEGYWTLESRSVLPSSSAINWETLLSGADCELHGYSDWGSKKPDFNAIYTDHWGMFPTLPGVIRDQMPKAEIGVIYSWDGIGYLYPKDAVNHDQLCPKNDEAVKQESASYIQAKTPTFLFVYFSQPDTSGHKFGWESDEYYAACDQIDRLVGDLVECIHTHMDMKSTAIIFTSDHGGRGKGHGGKSMEEMNVLFAVKGNKIPAGEQFEFPMMKYDVAPTILQLLQLKEPDEWRGKSILRKRK